MSIHKPRPAGNYIQIPNEVFDDASLDDRAVFYLCYLLSRSPDWHPRADQLATLSGHECSRATALRTMTKLRDAGYIKYERGRDQQTGQVFTRVHVYGSPQPDDRDYTPVESRQADQAADEPF